MALVNEDFLRQRGEDLASLASRTTSRLAPMITAAVEALSTRLGPPKPALLSILFFGLALAGCLWSVAAGLVALSQPNAGFGPWVGFGQTVLFGTAAACLALRALRALQRADLTARRQAGEVLAIGIAGIIALVAGLSGMHMNHDGIRQNLGESGYLVPRSMTVATQEREGIHLDLCFDSGEGRFAATGDCRAVTVLGHKDWSGRVPVLPIARQKFQLSLSGATPDLAGMGFALQSGEDGRTIGRKSNRSLNIAVTLAANGGVERIALCRQDSGVCTVSVMTRHGVLTYDTPEGVGEDPAAWQRFEWNVVDLLSLVQIC